MRVKTCRVCLQTLCVGLGWHRGALADVRLWPVGRSRRLAQLPPPGVPEIRSLPDYTHAKLDKKESGGHRAHLRMPAAQSAVKSASETPSITAFSSSALRSRNECVPVSTCCNSTIHRWLRPHQKETSALFCVKQAG